MMHHPINFVIICSGRTGSTWLSSSLNQHSMIHCGGELHHIFYGSQPDQFEEILVRSGPYGIQIPFRGFKLAYHILGGVDGWRFKHTLDVIDRFDPIVIFLNRKNLLEQFLSSCLSRRSQSYVMMKEDPNAILEYNRPIVLEADEYKYFRHTQFKYRNELSRRYPNAIELWYEDLRQGGIESVVEIFGLDVEEFPKTTKVLRRKTKKELIINYDEILEYLKSIGEEWQIEDPELTLRDFELRAVFREH